MKRDIVDELYSIAMKRFRNECPEYENYEITNAFADLIWYSIKGKLDHEGEQAAREYVQNAKLNYQFNMLHKKK